MNTINISNIGLLATIKSAIACYDFIGTGDVINADQAAVNAMRFSLSKANINGTIVIGEGERDSAPMLFIGERVGSGKEEVDIALDPLEGTNLCSKNLPGAITVIAVGKKGSIIHAPDIYMEKIATSTPIPNHILDLDEKPEVNITNFAKFIGCEVSEICVSVLDRERHSDLIASIRGIGAMINVITDGDITCIIKKYDAKASLYIGIGGAPEGVIAAAALKASQGFMQCRLKSSDAEQIERAQKMGISDFHQKLNIDDMIRSDVIFCATGVTSDMLRGVVIHEENEKKYVTTQSLILDSANRTKDLINRISELP